MESSAVPVSQMSTVAEHCLDTNNFTDQLLSVEKQIRDLKASIKASVASYKLQRQTPSVVIDALFLQILMPMITLMKVRYYMWLIDK